MRGIFVLGTSARGRDLSDVQARLEKLDGVIDAVVRADGRIFLEYEPEVIGDDGIVAALRQMGCRVQREAKLPPGKDQPEPWGLSVAGPGNTQLTPMAGSVRNAELQGFTVEEAEKGESNEAKFPGHSTE